MATAEIIIEKIKEQGLLPLFYHDDPGVCYEVVKALYEAGIRIIEFTNRGKNAPEIFNYLINKRGKDWPDMLLAIGTIKNVKEAETYIDAGADFIICPGIVKQVGEKVQQAGLLWIPGCMTTTEIMLAEDCGAKLVKIFPANILGPGFINAIRELFAHMKFIPTGGVEIEKENLKAWFDAGVHAVGLGSKLISKKVLINKDYTAITRMTKQVMEIIKSL